MDTPCFNCGRIILGEPAPFMVIMPPMNAKTGGYVCERCARSVGLSIQVFPLAKNPAARGYAVEGST